MDFDRTTLIDRAAVFPINYLKCGSRIGLLHAGQFHIEPHVLCRVFRTLMQNSVCFVLLLR